MECPGRTDITGRTEKDKGEDIERREIGKDGIAFDPLDCLDHFLEQVLGRWVRSILLHQRYEDGKWGQGGLRWNR